MRQRSPIRPRPALAKVTTPDGVDAPALDRAIGAVHGRLVELEARENARVASESDGGPSSESTTVALSSNVATASTSFVDVTGLSFPVRSGVRTRFRFLIPYDSSSTSFGSGWSVNGPTASALHLYSTWTRAAGVSSVGYGSTYDHTAANSNSLSTGNVAVIEGVVVPSVNGTVVARFLSGDGSVTVTARAGSSVTYEELS